MPEKFDFSKIEDQKEFENLPQEEKDEIVGEAQEETAKIQEKIVSHEVKNYEEAVAKISSNKFPYEGLKYPNIEIEADKEEIETIISSVINLKDFEGFVQMTHAPNANIILQHGYSEESWKKSIWHYAGSKSRKETRREQKVPVCLSVYKKNKTKSNWTDNRVTAEFFQPAWIAGGNIAFLFDNNKISDDNRIYDYEDFSELKHGDEININEYDQKMLKKLNNAIVGMVICGFTDNLVRKIKTDKGLHTAEERLNITEEQTYKIMTGRLTRIFEKRTKIEPKVNLVPVYDSLGNVIWPVQMSYEEVKKFVAERDKNKK